MPHQNQTRPAATRQRKTRVRTQSSDVFIGTGVPSRQFLPPPVDKKAQQAFALAEALKAGTTLAIALSQRRFEKSFLAGTVAELEGREPTAKELRSDGFKLGIQKITVERGLVDFKNEARELYQRSENKADADALTAEFQALYEKHYAGFDLESDMDLAMARQVNPEVQNIFSDLRALAQKDADTNILQQIEGDIQITVADEFEETGKIDWNAMNFDLMDSGVSGPRVNQVIAATARHFAEKFGDPSIIDSLGEIDKWPNTGASAPASIIALQSGLINSRKKAERIRKDRVEADNVAAVGFARSALTQLAESGVGGFDRTVFAASKPNEDGVIVLKTPEQIASVLNKWYDARETDQLETVNLLEWKKGNGRLLTNTEQDIAASQNAQEMIDNGATQEQVRAQTVVDSIVNNYVPSILKRELEINPANAQAFKNSVELFDLFEAQQPGFLGGKLKASQIDTFQDYKRRLDEFGGDSQKALEALSASDPDLIKNVPTKDLNEAKEFIRDELADGPFFSTLVRGSPALNKMVSTELERFINDGYSLEDSISNALDTLHPSNGRYTLVEGHLYADGKVWGTNPAATAEHARQQYAAENDIDADDVSIEPIPRKAGRVRIINREQSLLPGSVTERSISDLVDDWNKAQDVARRAAAEKGKKQALRKAEEIAKDELMSIPSSFGDPSTRFIMTEIRNDRWDALTDNQRELLINRSAQ